MNIRKKLWDWCRNPTKPISTSLTRLSRPRPLIASILLAEIIALLLVPIAYYAFFVPRSSVHWGLWQTFPLTNSQIKASWPNLPTAEQILKDAQSGRGATMIIDTRYYNVSSNSTATTIYLTAKTNGGPEITTKIENCTVLNTPNFKDGGIVPVMYDIWLPYNGTLWVHVPSSDLATNNPPPIPSGQESFLGTNLPTEYGIAAITVIAVTAVLSAGYLFLKRKRAQSFVSD